MHSGMWQNIPLREDIINIITSGNNFAEFPCSSYDHAFK
jgi:hypothetical protein